MQPFKISWDYPFNIVISLLSSTHYTVTDLLIKKEEILRKKIIYFIQFTVSHFHMKNWRQRKKYRVVVVEQVLPGTQSTQTWLYCTRVHSFGFTEYTYTWLYSVLNTCTVFRLSTRFFCPGGTDSDTQNPPGTAEKKNFLQPKLLKLGQRWAPWI